MSGFEVAMKKQAVVNINLFLFLQVESFISDKLDESIQENYGQKTTLE